MATPTQDTLAKMLQDDVVVYANIVKVNRLLIDEYMKFQKFNKLNKDVTNPDSPYKSMAEANERYAMYKRIQPLVVAQRKRYNKRQNDYRTNKAYNLSKSIKSWGGGVADTLKGWWGKIKGAAGMDGLGIFGVDDLIVAAVVVAVVGTSVIAYFVYKYKVQTHSDLVDGGEWLTELYKTNPAAAKSYQEALERGQNAKDKIQMTEAESGGFFGKIADGLKYGFAAVIVLGGGYAIYTNSNPKKVAA